MRYGAAVWASRGTSGRTPFCFGSRQFSIARARSVAARTIEAITAYGPHPLDRAIRAGVGAESAIQLFIGRDGYTLARQPRAPREQSAVGAQIAAVRPAEEHAANQKGAADRQH